MRACVRRFVSTYAMKRKVRQQKPKQVTQINWYQDGDKECALALARVDRTGKKVWETEGQHTKRARTHTHTHTEIGASYAHVQSAPIAVARRVGSVRTFARFGSDVFLEPWNKAFTAP